MGRDVKYAEETLLRSCLVKRAHIFPPLWSQPTTVNVESYRVNHQQVFVHQYKLLSSTLRPWLVLIRRTLTTMGHDR